MNEKVKRIKLWMAHNAITVTAAAALAHVSQQLFSAQLDGKRNITEDEWIKLQAAMHRYKYTGAESCPAQVA